MSIDAMRWAQQAAETGQLNTGQAFVLLLLGDHADERWSCWPSQELLARRSAQTVRSVERHVQRLKELGLVSTESMYGAGRGRVGLRYRLHEEALEDLRARAADPAIRMISPPDNLSGKSENREITRPDNLSGKSENREITRPDNLSGETTHPTITTDSPDNRASAHIKDRARTNPQENHQSVRQSVDAGERAEASTATDGPTTTDEPVVHRGVTLRVLRELVPAVADWKLSEDQLRRVVDVVLARAVGTVQSPTKYVARAMALELVELVELTRERPSLVVTTSAGVSAPSAGVRESRLGEPCENPDVHVANYGDAVLRDCPHCRIERRSMPRAGLGVGAGR